MRSTMPQPDRRWLSWIRKSEKNWNDMNNVTWTLWMYPLTMWPSKMTSCDVNLKSLLVYLDHKCNALQQNWSQSTEPPWHVGPLLIGHQRLAPMAVVAVPLAPDQYLEAQQDRSRTEKYQNIWKIIEKYALRTIARRITMITTNPKEVTCYFRLREHLEFRVEAYVRISCYPRFPNIELAYDSHVLSFVKVNVHCQKSGRVNESPHDLWRPCS